MTLVITLVGRDVVNQVSDRRFSDSSGKPVDDNGNKAIVVGFADALVSIMFTGVATFRSAGRVHRLDHWLAEGLQKGGIPELSPADAATFLAESATRLFKRFPAYTVAPHAFIMAGWQYGDAASPIARVISNDASGGGVTFSVLPGFEPPRNGTAVVTAGLHKAITRPRRRRLIAKLKGKITVDSAENALVSAIRDAALDPAWSWAINGDCTAVSISKTRFARATFYPQNGRAEAHAPAVVWNADGFVASVRDARVVAGAGYGFAFGGPASRFTLLVGGPGLGISAAETKFDGSLSLTEPKFGPPKKDGDQALLMTILDRPIPFGSMSVGVETS